MKTINELVSKELQVIPLEEDQEAVYRLIGAGEMSVTRTDDGTGIKIPNRKPLYRLAGRHSIYDLGQKKNILIKNVVTTEEFTDRNNDTRERPVIEPIRFVGGMFTCNWTQPETYAFMERHMKNVSNPFRKPGTKALFFRVDKQKEMILKLQEDNMFIDAQIFLRECSYEDLRRVAASILEKNKAVAFNLDDNLSLRNQLNDLAKSSPRQIILNSRSKDAVNKLIIMDLEKFGSIKFETNGANAVWSWTDIYGGDEFATIENVSDKYNSVISALSNGSIKKGEDILKQLRAKHQTIVKGIKQVA